MEKERNRQKAIEKERSRNSMFYNNHPTDNVLQSEVFNIHLAKDIF